MTPAAPRFEDLYFTQRTGLRLYGRRYPARGNVSAPAPTPARPVLCLPGLTRNGRDFHEIALALSDGPQARDVYTLDSRGRGLSAYDPDWRNYTVPVEMQDAADFIMAHGLEEAAILGTSRGGLIAMLLASVHPGLLGPVILNDIGPVIEQKGLARIASYVGRMPLPGTWAEAAHLIREMNGRAFPAIATDEWEPIARQIFNEKNGRPAPGYDPDLSRTFSALDGPLPPLWPQFEPLARLPVMVIRGTRSDILSAATVEEMKRRHPSLTDLLVDGQGHAPWLRDTPSIVAVRSFLEMTDKRH